MTTADDISAAWEAIRQAEEHYRQTLRAGFADGVSIDEASAATGGRSREMLRRDAMTDQQRADARAADTDRKRKRRTDAGPSTVPGQS